MWELMGAANANSRQGPAESRHTAGCLGTAVSPLALSILTASAFSLPQLPTHEKQLLRVGVSNGAACVVKKELLPFPKA